MKKFVIALSLFLFTGCATQVAKLPGTPLLPDPPASLKAIYTDCPEQLQGLNAGANFGDLIQMNKENGLTYYGCAKTGKGWADWYAEQQAKELEEIKNEAKHK